MRPPVPPRIRGLHNFRDVSASLGDHARIRSRRLFRSDAPDKLAASAWKALRDDLGIDGFLDLRAHPGRVRVPPAVATSRWVNVSLSDVGAADDSGTVPHSLTIDYVGRLTQDPGLPDAVAALADLLPRPTMVFCTAGKDRTGLVIATVLALVGVSQDAIVEEYMRTAAGLPGLLARRRAQAPLPLHPDFYRCSEPALREFLDRMERDHGGPEQWALARGVPRRALRRLSDALLGTQEC